MKRSFVFCRLFCSTPTKRRADWILYSVMMASSGSFFRWLPFSLKYRTSPVHLIYGAAIFVEKKTETGRAEGAEWPDVWRPSRRKRRKKKGNVLRFGTSLIVGGYHKYLVGPMNGCCNRIQRRRQTNGRTGPNLTAPRRLLRSSASSPRQLAAGK